LTETPLAVVVLAHADPTQVRRLVGALTDAPVFLHCDARTATGTYAAMVRGLPPRVRLLDRIPTQVASWSLVAAELAGVREALSRTDAGHIAVLSGTDYPLHAMGDLVAELAAWDGRTWLANVRMPYAPWGTRMHDDGGMWRLEHRFLTRGGNVVFVAGIPIRWPIRRSLPAEIEPRGASQWKIYARAHAQRLLDVVDSRPDLMRFWTSTLVPDESFAASMLASKALFGSDALPLQTAGAWFLEWEAVGHPRWLGEADYSLLEQAAHAPRVRQEAPAGDNFDYGVATRKLFARKVSTPRSSALMDLIDTTLRAAPAQH
jgi:hypothetical protein